MTFLRLGLLTAALSLTGGSVLTAAVIPVFGTGVSETHTPLAAGTADPHYTVTYGSVTGPAVVDAFHGDSSGTGAWVPDQPDAVWVSTFDQQDGLPAGVPIFYTTRFDLTGLDPSTVSMTISWAVDDSGVGGVFLNGVALPGSAAIRNNATPTSEPWAHFTTFTVTGKQLAFGSGVNVLSFVQDPSDGAVDGLIVQVSGTADPIAITSGVTVKAVVPVFSSSSSIQPGSWVSLFGTNMSAGTAVWDGTFPTTLGGTSVTINNKPAYLWFVSPTQLNVQAPDDTATGSVPVVVTTNGSSASTTVTLAPASPSFSILDGIHVAGIIYRFDGTGAYGGGTYDIMGPTGGSLGFSTVAAKAGDVVSLFGVGFGPTTPVVPAGQAFSGAAVLNTTPSVLINGIAVTPLFAGLTGAGLYQLNLTIPAGAGIGDMPLLATVGGLQTQANVAIALQ